MTSGQLISAIDELQKLIDVDKFRFGVGVLRVFAILGARRSPASMTHVARWSECTVACISKLCSRYPTLFSVESGPGRERLISLSPEAQRVFERHFDDVPF